MDQHEVRLDRETVSCSVCLDLLNDPVTIPCGHSYCMTCIKRCWDGEDGMHRCPQCRRSYRRKPELVKNTTLAAVVEELRKGGPEAAPAGPEDVACDVCTRRKHKALKSCLVCQASYCEHHLQPHRDAPPLKRHKLVDPSKNLQENDCCHVDVAIIAAERKEKQKELEKSRQAMRQRIKDIEKDLKVLQQEMKNINTSANDAVENSQKVFGEMVRLMEQRSTEVKQQIRARQEAEVGRVMRLQGKLKQEVADLKNTDAELLQLSHTEDHQRFLQNYSSASQTPPPPPPSPSPSSGAPVRPRRHFEDITAAVSEGREKLHELLRDTRTTGAAPRPDYLAPQLEPANRGELLQYSQEITLDANTANVEVLLSEGNRKATKMRQAQAYGEHPERFADCWQVLSRQSLTGRCYWEVEWQGRSVYVAVVYHNVSRKGKESAFGFSSKSWSLFCDSQRYSLVHNNVSAPVAGPRSARVGVFLDHAAGLLSFYSVALDTTTLLHTVHTSFLRPLHAGVWLGAYSSAEFCELQ